MIFAVVGSGLSVTSGRGVETTHLSINPVIEIIPSREIPDFGQGFVSCLQSMEIAGII